MRSVLVIACTLILGAGNAQKDKFKFNLDLTMGYVKYTYHTIETAGYYFSNHSWSDTVFYHEFERKTYNYHGSNTMVHAGIQFPVYRNEKISFGLWPKAGIGGLYQVYPKPSEVVDLYGHYIPEDPKILRNLSFDTELLAYFRLNFYTKNRVDGHLTVYGGYRTLNTRDDYSTPLIGFEIGQDHFALGWYSHFVRMNYYRQLSNGSIELAKTFHEFGLKMNVYLFDPQPKQKNLEQNPEAY